MMITMTTALHARHTSMGLNTGPAGTPSKGDWHVCNTSLLLDVISIQTGCAACCISSTWSSVAWGIAHHGVKQGTASCMTTKQIHFESETQHLTRLLYHPILGTCAKFKQVSLMSRCYVSCSVGHYGPSCS